MIEIRKPDERLMRVLPPVSPRDGVEYVPSQFALPFRHEGKAFVFNTLTKQCVEGILPERTSAGGNHDELIRALFLVPEGKDECSYYNQISALMRAYSRKRGIRGYTILPTLACNARCTYCYEEGMSQVSMTDETVGQTVRFILDTHEGDEVPISWFGGEPLMRPDLLDRICWGLRDAGLGYRSSMTSNASLVTPDIIAKMTGDWRLKRIQVSMDGAEADYVARKRYRSYNGYYRSVMAAVSAMSKAGIDVTIRCNVDESNWDDVPQFLRDLADGVADKARVGVYLAPLNDARAGEGCLAMWERIRDARQQIVGANLRPAPFMGLGLGFRTNHCMADGNSVVICPDGSLYACEHCPDGARFGDIWSGTTDEGAKREFCRADRTRDKCRGCAFLPDCTSFASCPVDDFHCKEVHKMMAVDALLRMVDNLEDAGGEDPIC